MSSQLTILAHVHAAEGEQAFVRAELDKLIAPTRAEEGCIKYDLHPDNEDDKHFVFFEVWESRELWQAHMANDHLTAYMAAVDGKIASFTLHELSFTG